MDLCTPARTAIAVRPIRLLRIVMCKKVFRARHTHLYSDANAEKRVYGTRTFKSHTSIRRKISHISIDSAMQADDANKLLLAVDFRSRMIES